ncbi:EAL domain-containing response regulator [Thalassospira sp. HF15]|uniref:EAL domain-containing response regulator n=1 Tax=Thalassospira sp. HF15 TaxID=2722755 RepID=UPI001430ED75|nr:EAL domain-containing response regulator [Thalassospira sp. HF15]NIY74626.1 EAL domain-containing response regulator [Thalassospira sp. HF15]
MHISKTDQINILVIDDETDMSEFVADAVTAIGHNAVAVSDADDFVRAYSTAFDVIILDLFMPKLDGIEIIRFLHENRSHASLVLMSGKDKSILHSASELASERNMEVLGVLEKPFTIDQLEAILDKFIPHAHRQKAPPSDIPTEQGLRRGIADHEFFLVYQPQFDLNTGMISGVEALLRWQHPVRGLIHPGLFIPLAEQSGLINNLTEYVLEEAMSQMARWRDHDITMSINVSPTTVVDLDMPEKLDEMIKARDIAPEKIIIELTETAIMENVGSYMDILTRLRMKNFGLSIDDFGIGYSSMQQLVRVPFNELKIDQSFIRQAVTDRECQAVTQMSMSLAHGLNMRVVAEGIENQETYDWLKSMGCEIGQGFHMARPTSPVEIEERFLS